MTHRKPRGRHPQHRLTAVSVRAKTTPGRYADGNGLYLEVDPSGAKRWLWRGVVRGRRRDLGLGSVTLVPLLDARKHALDYRRDARVGKDPKPARSNRTVPTFRDAAKTVHAEHAEGFRNDNHKGEWLSSLERYAFPIIGSRSVDAIDSSEILKVLSPVWLKKPETARRVRQRIALIFDWARAHQFRTADNPVNGLLDVLPKHRDEAVHHAALPYAKLPAFLETLRAADAVHASVRLAFELLILTATRTNETLGARWEEVDLDAAVWTIPGERMKSGRDHRIPLSTRVVEIFTAARALAGKSPYVFPGRSKQKPLSNMVFLMTLRRLPDYTDITAHGFRSSFRDWAAERTNVPREVCEAALAHVKKDKTEAAYNRTDLFEKRRDLMTSWARFATGTPATVVAIGA